MDSNALKATVEQLLAQQQPAIDEKHAERKRFKPNVPKRDIELALTVLLVDLAASDQNFDPCEYQVIVHGMMRMFGTKKHEVSALINQAQNVLRNLRGVNRFAALLKNSLSVEERQTIMDIIEDVIAADGVEDDYEIYLRHKLKSLLGLSDS